LLLGGRHSPAAALKDILVVDFAAKRLELLELTGLETAWRQRAVVLGNFLVAIGGRTRQNVSHTITAISMVNGSVLRAELPGGLHTTSSLKARDVT
jgi:hypothetical protein